MTEKENPSEGGENQSAVDQQKTVVQEPTVADDKVEGILEAKEDEVSTEKPSDNQTLETKSSAYPPSLKTARVDDDGTALVAGSAYPGSILEILIDETVVETIKVGQDGNFAVLFDLELKDTPQVISIRSIENGEIFVSEETMIVAPKVIELAQATPVDTQTETQSVEEDVSEPEDEPQKQMMQFLKETHQPSCPPILCKPWKTMIQMKLSAPMLPKVICLLKPLSCHNQPRKT
ncbi:MAG: hypothetical protein CM15mP85_13540 [Rhodobacterales bacterium]|nr:MAG: hypothetical protein CM15mP85_13540 [Rhodobacterales bacterium]